MRGAAAALLTARLLIGALMVGGAMQKTLSPDDAGGLLTGMGLPYALVWPALIYDAAAGLALWLGIAVRPVAVTASVYCAVTSFFHLDVFLTTGDSWQMTIFGKNWAIAGGCLALAVAGSGPWAVRPDRP
ncbi:putative oxidoreductase [Loktanella fryxellensis]|uniref:Putative oxidoreductase n=1 Tax=Loktanella fryxellensis TaxID=245187 RepID=A0A1H7YQT5_9RHOB|nr:DoxX family membrane protein [Loktanella fryxellensis]SEM47549.1 putative oxidoreductase [Loktanella fryxellensis]